ncbi:TonB-dependent receptor [Sphingomonas sp.]|jgi:iron complex outermembrane receptor protein|uniref:TonB-dependent receptor n=1 Tax=Sphingomonas sp. TaxID=28214 RepID=UPI002D7FC58D|nr:TonB-dependent receptor [Sphingomonas sp.]HEU0043971.1 TonB-dependent receptor [Sphingomonas sp.]
MKDFARVALATLLASTAWSGAAAQQAGPQPAEPTVAQEAATTGDVPPEDDTSGRDVIITGSRTPKAVDKIPGAVTVVTPAEVQRSLAITEDNTAILAKTVPGYSESNQTLNTLGETLRGRASLYLFDGIPQSTPLRDGSRNATFTDMSIVERIEVISGASASEGIGAAGGVINYITKRATREGFHANVGGRLGTQFRDDSGIWGIKGDIAYKSGGFDVFAAAAYVDRGATYDARGRRIGLSASSSLADTEQKNFFLKTGFNFGESQRLELTGNFFRLASKGNYRYVAGIRPPAGTDQTTGLPDTSERGPQLVNGGDVLRTEFNEFKQAALNYSNTDLFGGSLLATAYYARQAMRFGGENTDDRQDPLIAPIGTLVDQSEINSKKYGLRTSYTLPEFLTGLEVRVGIDAVYDNTEQRLALTDRVLVPPLKYTSFGPYAQLSYDIGPVTITGGVRHEDGRVKVDDYNTLFRRNRAFVTGGTLKYTNDLLNGGIIARFGGGFSAFASYSEGFTLPNVGIPLRNISTPNQSVEGIVDLQAVIFENKEIGANWRGSWGSFGASYYRSYSRLGANLSVDPATLDFVLNRRPVRITGVDATAELRPVSWLRLNALYSHVKGMTSAANNITEPLNVQLGITNIAPDKLNLTATVMPTPALAFSLGMDQTMDRTVRTGAVVTERTKGRTLFDATVRYKIDDLGTVSLGAENLFNKFYFLAFSQIDFFQNYFAGRGRTVTLSLRSDF